MLLVTDSAEPVLLTAHEQPHIIAQTAHMIQRTIIFLVSMMVLFFSSIKKVKSHKR